MRIAAAQIRLVAGDVDANVSAITTAVTASAERGATLVVLPEASLTGYDDERLHELAIAAGDLGRRCAPLARVSAETGVTIVASSPVRRARGTTMSVVLVEPSGAVSTPYDKRFLDADERRTLVHGDRPAVIDIAGTTFGLGICHDLSFPEAALDSARLGATMLLQPSLCAAGSEFRQDVRAAARALDTGSWLILASPVGQCGRLTAVGRSTVVDPHGVIVEQLADRAGLLVADVDPSRADRARRQRPLMADRRATGTVHWSS